MAGRLLRLGEIADARGRRAVWSLTIRHCSPLPAFERNQSVRRGDRTSSTRRSTPAPKRARAIHGIHALEASGGLSYAQMGRFQSAAKPAAGTSEGGGEGRKRQPVVGVALILTGIGLLILAFAVFRSVWAWKEALGT